MVRLEADALRKSVAAARGSNPATAIDEHELRRAKRFDSIGDLLLGLQGVWDHHGGAELVRDGFKRMSRNWDKSQTYVLAVEAAPVAEPKTDEIAA